MISSCAGWSLFGARPTETKKEANAQARQMFEKAIELDPQYAEAYAWLGQTYTWIGSRVEQDPQTLERVCAGAKSPCLDESLPMPPFLA